MNIAFDHQIFSVQRFGGVSRYFFELANQLAAIGPEVNCQINCPLYVNNYLRHSRQELQINGIPMPRNVRGSSFYRAINSLMSPVIFYGSRPDIVHETYYAPKSVAPASSRIVVTVYDMIHELYPDYMSEQDRTAKYKKIAVERADHVICISENTRQDLIHFLGVDHEKISVVHLGFSLTKSSISSLPAKNRPFILYVGARGGYKNFEGLLAAYASHADLLNNYNLVLFGGGSLNTNEVDRIQSMHIPLVQVRQVSGDDGVLAALYKQADMFVYPSLYEGFGIPPLEAMSFDCPVACSNTSSIPEVVGDAAIQFNPLDTDSIADALLSLSLDSALRANLIDLGRIRLEKFSWEKCATQTLDVYKTLLQ